MTTFAGSARSKASANGMGGNARFNGSVALAVDNIGNIFVADTKNHTIRKITASTLFSCLA